MNPNTQVKIYAKMEGFNPTGSLKDRVALRMIEEAEKEGKLTLKKTVVEATAGNTGISVAWVAALKGYKCLIVMPDSVSIERVKILEALRANIVFVSTEAELVQRARAIATDPQYFLTDQFLNDNNWLAHYHTTGEEIWRQTDGTVTHFIAGIGSGGTLMGVGRKLKKYNPQVQIIKVEPSHPNNKQEGLVNHEELRPEILNLEELDSLIRVEDDDAFQTAQQLFLYEGLFVGISSGSVMKGALQIVRELKEGVIVTLFGDNGFKYLSTNLYT